MSVTLRRYFRGATLATLVTPLTGERRTYHLDHQGTVQCLTNAQGVVTDRFACDAWGNEFRRTGPSLNRQWYIGHLGYYRQVDQALDYVRAEYYGPQSGQVLSLAYGRLVGDQRARLLRTTQTTASVRTGAYRRRGADDRWDLRAPRPQFLLHGRTQRDPRCDKPDTFGGYGCYCGGDRNPFYEPPPFPDPVDEIDRCCQAHDRVYHEHRCLPIIDPRWTCHLADLTLCWCAINANCRTSPDPNACKSFRRRVMALFCSVGLLCNPDDPPRPNPDACCLCGDTSVVPCFRARPPRGCRVTWGLPPDCPQL